MRQGFVEVSGVETGAVPFALLKTIRKNKEEMNILKFIGEGS